MERVRQDFKLTGDFTTLEILANAVCNQNAFLSLIKIKERVKLMEHLGIQFNFIFVKAFH